MNLTFTYNNMQIEYPQHLCSEIPDHEARVIGTLVNDLSLMVEVQGRRNLFHTKDGLAYYDLLNDMYNHKATEFDTGSVQSALSRLGEQFKNDFISLNGMGHLNSLRRNFSPNNFETHFEGLMKTNAKLATYRGLYEAICMLHNDIETKSLEDIIFKIEDTLETARNCNDVSTTKPVILRIDNDYIQSKINGVGRGMSYNLFSISKATRGMHNGNMSMLAMPTNNGKTTINYNEIMLDFLDKGEKVFIYSNESAIDDFKDMLLIRTLTKHLKYYDLTRTKLNELDMIKTKEKEKYEEYMMKIAEAQRYIDVTYNDKLVLYCVSRYSIAEFNILMRRFSHKGFTKFLIDTMKSEDAGDKLAVGKLVQQSRNIYELARKLNVHVMASYQIASYLKQNMKRIYDESCLSGSKQIVEILDILITGRELYPDEYPGQKNEIKVFKIKKDEITGKYVKEFKELESNKKYLVFFLPKNRYGAKIVPTIYQFNGEFGTLFEVGFTESIQEKSF